MKRIAKGGIAAVAVVGIAGGIVAGTASGSGSPERYYDVTVENLTAGQPLSPPLIVQHTKRASVWGVGEIASHPVAAIAEDANNAPAISVLEQVRGVRDAQTGIDAGAAGPAPIGPGASQTYRIEARPRQQISLLSMLVNTNDGFTGLDGVRLGKARTVIMARAYDAGSEENNQLESHIPGPVGGNPFVRAPEGELVRMHPGVQAGVGDLDPAAYGWTGPVAKITISPVR